MSEDGVQKMSSKEECVCDVNFQGARKDGAEGCPVHPIDKLPEIRERRARYNRPFRRAGDEESLTWYDGESPEIVGQFPADIDWLLAEVDRLRAPYCNCVRRDGNYAGTCTTCGRRIEFD